MESNVGTDVARAAACLRAGQLVAIPTETVYGLAANAFDPKAVLAVFRAKQRPTFDPLIVHAASQKAIQDLVTDFPATARQLAEAYWPGPLTLLLPKNSRIADLITSGLPRVAVRVPAHPLTRELLQQLPFPLTAPSANPFGYISPTNAAHVAQQLGDRVAYILDGGPSRVGVESTIVGWEDDQTVVYRLGGLQVEALESLVGPVRVQPRSSSRPDAPGMLLSHYAPRKPCYVGVLPKLLVGRDPATVGVLAFRAELSGVPADQQRVLSPTGDLDEAAQGFFAALRILDADARVAVILAEPFPETGLGRALNDRLRRAATGPA